MGAWLSKATPASSPSPGWASLPPELADLILRRLSSFADRLRFAAVCRHWRHVGTRYSAPNLPRILPWLNFHDGSFRSLPDGELHSFRFGMYGLCAGSAGSGSGWLLFEKESSKPRRRHFLKNPLLRTTMRLPGRCRDPVVVVALDHPDDVGSQLVTSTPRRSSTRFSICKVIVCSSDLVVAMVEYKQRQCVLVCCRPGMSSSWSTGLCNGHWYQDMAFYKGKLYAVTEDGNLFVHEVCSNKGREPRVSRVEQVIRAPSPFMYTLDGPDYATLKCIRTCYLVISRAQKLLMVRWIVPHDHYTSADSTKKMTFKVFEADLETSQWRQVKSLDDQVLFVSSSCSKAISASSHRHCRHLKGNQIYFIDEGTMFWPLWPTSNPRTGGVYDMSRDIIHNIPLGHSHMNDQTTASWFFP